MKSARRGLSTWHCPTCEEIVAHRTLYIKLESAGRSRWLQIYRACAQCLSLNAIILPLYRLKHIPSQPPSKLSQSVVDILEDGPLDSSQLITRLRQHRISNTDHVLESEVSLVVEHLKGVKVVEVRTLNRTEQVLQLLRTRGSESRHLGPCPAELKCGLERKTLVSLYVQRWAASKAVDNESHLWKKRLLPAGTLCFNCLEHKIDRHLIR